MMYVTVMLCNYQWEYEPAIMNNIYILAGSYSLCWLTRHGCWCYWSKTQLRKAKTCVLMTINGTLVRLYLDLSPNPFWESNHGFLLDRGFLIAMILRGKILQLKSPLISTLIIHSNTCQGKGSGNWSETWGVSWRSDGLLQKPSLLNATTIESVSLMLNPLSCSRNSRVVGGNPQTLKEYHVKKSLTNLGSGREMEGCNRLKPPNKSHFSTGNLPVIKHGNGNSIISRLCYH